MAEISLQIIFIILEGFKNTMCYINQVNTINEQGDTEDKVFFKF